MHSYCLEGNKNVRSFTRSIIFRKTTSFDIYSYSGNRYTCFEITSCPQIDILVTKCHWGKFCGGGGEDGCWGDKHRRFSKVKQKDLTIFASNHILFMLLSIQPCLTIIAASYLQGERRGKKGEERGLGRKKKKKKVKSLQYYLEPLGVSLYHFSSCTDLE